MHVLHLPHPLINETIESYLSRILIGNCYTSNSDLNILFELDEKIHVTIKSSQKEILRKRLDSPFTVGLWRDEDKGKWCLSNEYLRKFLFSSHYTKVCPQCLSENLYYRCVWRCLGYTTCHIHDCIMQNQCLCGRKIVCLSPELGTCKCGLELKNLPRTIIKQPKVNHNVFFQMMYNKRLIQGSHPDNYVSSFLYREYVELLFRLVNIDYQNNYQISLLTAHHPNDEVLRLSLERVFSYISNSNKQLSELLIILDKSIFSDELIRLKEELTLDCFSSVRDEIDMYLNEKNSKKQLHKSIFLNKITQLISIASSNFRESE
ncbi:TniQ family protein [Paenibacillus taichungensis]|uniref:TniQ family protein n=1 Tax=Paenibacillus taichungensis TaxID=484184 RepID=UPI0035C71D1C